MAKTRILVDLFRAIASQNLEYATTIASQICRTEEQNGHVSAARALRGALHQRNGAVATITGPDTPGFLTTALVNLPSDIPLSNVVLTAQLRIELEGVIKEWEKRDQLAKRGLKPRAKLLFHGPPGCGKSITARALSHALNMPIFLVRFDSVIGAYLGQTAIHLRQLFHFTETTPCILLLDELDALGKQRGNPLDVGELDRIVIALMQELEHSNPLGLIIGTSNLAQNLDDALWRRFDLTLLFKPPTKRLLAKFCIDLADKFEMRLSPTVLGLATKAKSFSDAEAIVIAEARRQTIASE